MIECNKLHSEKWFTFAPSWFLYFGPSSATSSFRSVWVAGLRHLDDILRYGAREANKNPSLRVGSRVVATATYVSGTARRCSANEAHCGTTGSRRQPPDIIIAISDLS